MLLVENWIDQMRSAINDLVAGKRFVFTQLVQENLGKKTHANLIKPNNHFKQLAICLDVKVYRKKGVREVYIDYLSDCINTDWNEPVSGLKFQTLNFRNTRSILILIWFFGKITPSKLKMLPPRRFNVNYVLWDVGNYLSRLPRLAFKDDCVVSLKNTQYWDEISSYSKNESFRMIKSLTLFSKQCFQLLHPIMQYLNVEISSPTVSIFI